MAAGGLVLTIVLVMLLGQEAACACAEQAVLNGTTFECPAGWRCRLDWHAGNNFVRRPANPPLRCSNLKILFRETWVRVFKL